MKMDPKMPRMEPLLCPGCRDWQLDVLQPDFSLLGTLTEIGLVTTSAVMLQLEEEAKHVHVAIQEVMEAHVNECAPLQAFYLAHVLGVDFSAS